MPVKESPSRISLSFAVGSFIAKYNLVARHATTSNSFKNTIGLDLRVSSRFFLYKGIFAQSDLSFTQKGGEDKIVNGFKSKTNQLEGSIVLGYEQKIKSLSFYFNLGGYYGRILSVNNKLEPLFIDGIVLEDSKWDYGLIYGGGFSIPLKKGSIGCEYRYRFSKNETKSRVNLNNTNSFFTPKNTYENVGWGVNLVYSIKI
jgi:hypothetical protein